MIERVANHNKVMINNNLGMYIEQLVDRTISYLQTNNLGFLEKRQIPIKIIKNLNPTTVVAKLISKAKVDYFGYIRNHYIEFECKQTKQECFDMSLIKPHQLNYLKFVHKLNGRSYIMIYFEIYDAIICLSYSKLIQCCHLIKKKTLPFSLLKKYGIEIEIIYPGILDLSKLF